MNSNGTLSERAAEEIRAILARRRVTGRELARRLDVSSPWVSQRLTGATEIGLNDLERIADALDVSVADLLPAPVKGDESRQIRYSDAPAARLSAAVRHPVDPRPIRTRGTASGRPRTARAAWTHAEVTA